MCWITLAKGVTSPSRQTLLTANIIDIIEETLYSQGTFHATQVIAFQRGIPRRRSDQEIRLGSERLLNVPVELQQLKYAPDCGTRAQPHFHEDVNMVNYKPDETMAKTANTKDVAWLLVRHYSSPQQAVPA